MFLLQLTLLYAVLVHYSVVAQVRGIGAGRAIPVDTENYVIKLFREINPNIEYDFTNFLVDLSGLFSNCKYIGVKNLFTLDRITTADGQSIAVAQDFTYGTEANWVDVDKYLRPAYEEWTYGINSVFIQQIKGAQYFGCSVRPACTGQLSFSCLFTPSVLGKPPPVISTTTTTVRTTRSTTPDFTYRPSPDAFPHAQAFTREQYDEASNITNMKWDKSHYLENLSGLETHCNMVPHLLSGRTWDFPEAKVFAKDVQGRCGIEENINGTPGPLKKILEKMDVPFERSADKVGCSLIPDCWYDGRLYVIVSCLFRL